MIQLCATRPADWWEVDDDGARLALTICRACPGRDVCAATAGREAGVIRAGVAYLEGGQVARICGCGYPDLRWPDPRRPRTTCQRCGVPKLRPWSRRRYWADYYRRRKATATGTNLTKETRA